MSELAALQKRFIQVLQGKDPTDFADIIVAQGQINNLTRINIYRNAYHQRLKESIEVDHAILGYYLGDDLFDQMVSGYIAAYPSQQTSLRYFSEQLPFFLAATAPFNAHPVLTDLARFERNLLTAFDAPDASLANADILKQIPIPDWPQLHFLLHPSVQHYQSSWNAVEIWQALKQQKEPPATNKHEQHWLIWRNAERLTEFSSLNIWELTFLESILQGQNYAAICEKLTEHLAMEQVSEASVQCLLNWLSQGIIRKLSIET